MSSQSNTSRKFALNKFNLPIEAFTKSYLKDLKPALKLRRERIRVKKAALKKAKKEAKRKEKERKRIESLKKTNAWIQATKHAKTVVRREILEMLKDMEKGWYDIADAITELERQLQ